MSLDVRVGTDIFSQTKSWKKDVDGSNHRDKGGTKNQSLQRSRVNGAERCNQPHSFIAKSRKYSGTKEPPVRSWDRNKARIESIYQLPTRDFRQTAAQFGVPPSVAGITTTEGGIPKMECTTTTKSDYCRPSLDRYVTMPGVCPDKEYPSSSGLEYCPERPREEKAKPPSTITPVMPRTRSTCPASMSSLLPNSSAIPKFDHLPSIPYHPSCSAKNEVQSNSPPTFSRGQSIVDVSKQAENEYAPKVDYFEKQPGFKWPIPLERNSSNGSVLAKQDVDVNPYSETSLKTNPLPKPDFQGGGESARNIMNYSVETEDHEEKRRIHDANIERARMEYERMIGSPGSTSPLVKAGIDPPSAVAHYNVPDYTQGTAAGGVVRPRFGAPNLEMKLPITDPSYPQPQYTVPPPEAGLTRMTYSGLNDGHGRKPGVDFAPPVRYPDKIYNASAPAGAPPGGKEDVTRPQIFTGITPEPARNVPSIIEAQKGENEFSLTNKVKTAQTSSEKNSDVLGTDPSGKSAPMEQQLLKGIRRIQTTNQIYGSWIDDPYLKDNDWWFKAKAKMPIQKTYLSRYREESGWH